MSFLIEPWGRRFLAMYPAKMSPKFPVGTEKSMDSMAVSALNLKPGIDIIDDLGKNAGPVDGIDCTKVIFIL